MKYYCKICNGQIKKYQYNAWNNCKLCRIDVLYNNEFGQIKINKLNIARYTFKLQSGNDIKIESLIINYNQKHYLIEYDYESQCIVVKFYQPHDQSHIVLPLDKNQNLSHVELIQKFITYLLFQ